MTCILASYNETSEPWRRRGQGFLAAFSVFPVVANDVSTLCLCEWIAGPLDGHIEPRSQGVKHRYLMEVVNTGIFEHCYLSEIPGGPGVDRVRLFHTEVVIHDDPSGGADPGA